MIVQGELFEEEIEAVLEAPATGDAFDTEKEVKGIEETTKKSEMVIATKTVVVLIIFA